MGCNFTQRKVLDGLVAEQPTRQLAQIAFAQLACQFVARRRDHLAFGQTNLDHATHQFTRGDIGDTGAK